MIGFHLGVPSNTEGLREYLAAIAEAGHSVCLVGADTAGELAYALKLAEANSVDHFLVYRKTHYSWGTDVPVYTADPREMAEKYWQELTAVWPPGLSPKKIYAEFPNEPDKNQSAFLAELALEAGKIAVANDRRYCAPAWSMGEPEPTDWLHWKPYLELCEKYPDNLAISVHEYTGDKDTPLLSTVPWLIGRVTFLNQYCKSRGITPPTVIISEFGWGANAAPPSDVAIPELVGAYEWYAQNAPNVRGISVWCLDRGWQWKEISKTVNSYLEPLSKVLSALKPPIHPPQNGGSYKSVVFLAPQKSDILQDLFLEIAKAAYGEYGRTLTMSADNAIVMVQDGNEESYIVVWEPDLPSQVAAIQKLDEAGVQYETRYLRKSALDGLAFAHPFSYMYGVTSKFNDIRSYGNKRHEGVDFDIIGGLADSDVHVLAPYGGVVLAVLDSGTSGYGLHVKLGCENNGKKFTLILAHLDRAFVRTGQVVKAGDSIGELGSTGNSTGEHVHITLSVPEEGLTGYIYPYVVDPLPYFPKSSASLPVFSREKVYDILSYILPGSDGPLYEVQHVGGGTETFQTRRVDSTHFLLIKNSQFETFRFDGKYIWRGLDTSPGPAPVYAERPGELRFYRQYEDGDSFARWCRAQMAVGDSFVGPGHLVQFFYKHDCVKSSANSGPATNIITFLAHYDAMEFNSIVLADVIELTDGKEHWFFAKDYGLVAWRNEMGDQSAISEIHSNRPNLEPEILRCA